MVGAAPPGVPSSFVVSMFAGVGGAHELHCDRRRSPETEPFVAVTVN